VTAIFADITPVTVQCRFFTMFEALIGTLYAAILIARLTATYP
jgi:hypothetical protein